MDEDESFIGGEGIETELDWFIACIRHMRLLHERSPIKGQKFQGGMEDYFRLSPELRSSLVYDELLRLADLPAGRLRERDPKILKKIYDLVEGSYFRINKRLCVFQRHNRLPSVLLGGWITFRYDGEYVDRSLDYEEAWSKATDGLITFGKAG